MRVVFADANYWIGLFNPKDQLHDAALAASRSLTRTTLGLGLIILLDKVQKGQRISAEECKQLRAAKLVEGRYPNLIVAGRVAAVAGQKAQHIRNRGFDGQYYRDMVVALVREHQPVSREDIDRLLLDKLPEVLTPAQKLNRIHNLLRQLAKGGVIVNSGSRRWPKWVLARPAEG